MAAPAGAGRLLIAGPYGGRVVKLSASGRAAIVAGRVPKQDEGTFSGDGGPAADALFGSIGGVAALADGGFLVADTRNHRVRRVSADGIVTTVAGTGQPGFNGDEGPAVEVSLRRPMGLAVEADGGVLVADTGNHRVRRVRADGIIETAAGNGARADAGDGGAATKAGLMAPVAVAVGRGSDFLIADRNARHVRRVAPTGRISTVAGDGGEQWGTSRDAGLEPWPGGGSFDRLGGPAKRASIGRVNWVSVTDDGTYLLRSGDEAATVSMLPSRRTRRLGVAFSRLRPKRNFISYTLNRRAHVTLDLKNKTGRTLTQTVGARARAGLNRIRLPVPTAAGLYYLRLTAKTADGYRSADEVGVVLGRTLSRRITQLAIDAALDRFDYENIEAAFGCHRMSPTRIDCRIEDIDSFACQTKVAVRLRKDGQLASVRYPCGRWRHRVPWRRAESLPLLLSRYELDA